MSDVWFHWLHNTAPLLRRRIMILLEVTVLRRGSEVKEKLGAPNQLQPDGAGTDGFGGCSGLGVNLVTRMPVHAELRGRRVP